MKAFVLEDFDSPARMRDIPDPELTEGGLLIGIRSASVNNFDVATASGALKGMLEHAFPVIVGRDFSGEVEAVGSAESGFAVGDQVFGYLPAYPTLQAGSFAERVHMGPGAAIVRMPEGLDFHRAACLPLAGAAALQAVEAIDPDPAAVDRVLIVGATGSVGTFAVQLVARTGAHVIATARPEVEEFVRDLGAQETIDYTTGSVEEAIRERYPDGVHAIIDLVSQKEAFAGLAALVMPGGRVATTQLVADEEALAAKQVKATNVFATPDVARLTKLADLAASGELKIPIQRVYPFAQTEEALLDFQKGIPGRLVISMTAE